MLFCYMLCAPSLSLSVFTRRMFGILQLRSCGPMNVMSMSIFLVSHRHHILDIAFVGFVACAPGGGFGVADPLINLFSRFVPCWCVTPLFRFCLFCLFVYLLGVM